MFISDQLTFDNIEQLNVERLQYYTSSSSKIVARPKSDTVNSANIFAYRAPLIKKKIILVSPTPKPREFLILAWWSLLLCCYVLDFDTDRDWFHVDISLILSLWVWSFHYFTSFLNHEPIRQHMIDKAKLKINKLTSILIYFNLTFNYFSPLFTIVYHSRSGGTVGNWVGNQLAACWLDNMYRIGLIPVFGSCLKQA